MQAQLFRKTKKPRIHSPIERRLRLAELLHDESRKIAKFNSGSSSPTNVANVVTSPSYQPRSLTSSPYDGSSNSNDENKQQGVVPKPMNKKKCKVLPCLQPHAVCLNHITAQPYCSIDMKALIETYPKYYKGKHKYVLSWLRKNFGRTAKPKPPPPNQESSSESSDDDSTSDTDEDTTETETEEDIAPQLKRRRFISEETEESSLEMFSDSDTTTTTTTTSSSTSTTSSSSSESSSSTSSESSSSS